MSGLRLLYLPQCQLSRELGGSKVQLALADHLRLLGWHVECRFPFHPSSPAQLASLAEFDVVDWDPRHALQRHWLPPTSLSICRFPLLALHFAAGVPWPQPARRWLDPLLDPWRRLRGRTTPHAFERQAVEQVLHALPLADAISVQNSADRACLMDHGIAAVRIVVEPCGLSEPEFAALSPHAAPDPHRPLLSFVGSFDHRKGCPDLAWLAPRLGRRFPALGFRLIGTNGLFQGEAAVRRWFPAWLQPRLQVIPSFASATLSQHLAGVRLGVFPSYLEGFGIAVIEQLAAGIPVLAYAAPGPADILPADWLVPRGDRTALLDRLSAQLSAAPAAQAAARAQARAIAAPYRWAAIAERWDGHYRRLLAGRRA
jgi:glycosyltransferase involved in cell wall biosynthesis